MGKRPTSVTVISWILIVLSAISILSMALTMGDPRVKELMALSPLPYSVQIAIGFIGAAITIIAGIWMLKGQAWARLLYVVWTVIGLVIGIATSPMKLAMLPGLGIFLVFAYFLFRPAANEYFAGNKV